MPNPRGFANRWSFFIYIRASDFMQIKKSLPKWQGFVGVAGFEPAASCSQSRRDNRATLHPEAAAKIELFFAYPNDYQKYEKNVFGLFINCAIL
jgi:hypothetical protein